jgi:hypothetical protein
MQAEQASSLVEHEQHARAGREADDHGVRDVAASGRRAAARTDRELDVPAEAARTSGHLHALGRAPMRADGAQRARSEIALVGPLTDWRDESSSGADRRHRTMAV